MTPRRNRREFFDNETMALGMTRLYGSLRRCLTEITSGLKLLKCLQSPAIRIAITAVIVIASSDLPPLASWV